MTNVWKLALIAAVSGVTFVVNAEEFGGYDAMSLAQGKRVETDCSIT